MIKLKNLITIQKGDYPLTKPLIESDDDKPFLYTEKDLPSKLYWKWQYPYYAPKEKHDAKLFKKDSILFKLFNAQIVTNNFRLMEHDGYVMDNLCVVRTEVLLPKFLYLVLEEKLTNYFYFKIDVKDTYDIINNNIKRLKVISLPDFLDITIKVPSKEEQEEIIAHVTSIQKTFRVLEQTKNELKRKIFNY